MIKSLKSKKGFTLVEVIVVLVILAILAAILVPTMTGYIDKANEKVVVSEARAVYMALQVAASDAYAKNPTAADSSISGDDLKKVADMAEVPVANITANKVSGGKVVSFSFDNGSYTFTWAEATGAGATPTTFSDGVIAKK